MDNLQQSYSESKTYPNGTMLGVIKIISRTDKDKFLVECTNCGRQFEVKQSSLSHYKVSPPISCRGCISKALSKPKKYKPGQIIGNCYELIEPLGNNNWLVKCTKCGKVQKQALPNMKKHTKETCFYCEHPEIEHNPQSDNRVHCMDIDTRIYTYYKGHVESHNKTSSKYKSFELSKDEFVKLIHSDCYYCGAAPSDENVWNQSNKRQSDKESVKINGIDRIDSNKGYIKGNCVPCCIQCNRMKLDYTKEQFLSKVKQIYYKMLNDQSNDVASSECEMGTIQMDKDMV